MKIKLILTVLLLDPFMAFAEESMGDPNEFGTCVAARDLLDKIILYGSSLVVTLVAAFTLAKTFGQKAARKRSKFVSAHENAGRTLGLLLGSITFSAMLYVTSTKLSTAQTVMSGSCYPDGWTWVAGIFFLVSLVLFIFTYSSAK